MATVHKFLEMFRNLKSDAVPRSPRPNNEKPIKIESEQENNENVDSSNEPEEILVESDDEFQSEKKPKNKYSKPKNWKPKKEKHSNSSVNTQATGNVINVVNASNFHWGNVYNLGPVYNTPTLNTDHQEEVPEEQVKKTPDIKLLLESKIKPEHEYLEHISKYLGKNWQSVYLKLGFEKSEIETMVIDTEKYGVKEARYKLLLNWIEGEEDPSLGRLATALWRAGERTLVNKLARIYKQNIK